MSKLIVIETKSYYCLDLFNSSIEGLIPDVENHKKYDFEKITLLAIRKRTEKNDIILIIDCLFEQLPNSLKSLTDVIIKGT